MSAERASLPEPGEQVTFEVGDCENVRERVTIRVSEVLRGGIGMIVIAGWRIGEHGLPVGALELSVSVATVEARRVHRCRPFQGGA